MSKFINRMQPGVLTKYSASAGSGKTYELAAIYLRSLFRDPLAYRSILAVTFTNKASAEMKNRILGNLYLLAIGRKSEYSDHIESLTGRNKEWIGKKAREILDQILHDYSYFSVGTIDSFFQKVLRSFARESGLQSGFNTILDSKMVLLASVDAILQDAEEDDSLLRWLIDFGQREIMEGRSWNLKTKILNLGEEIFKEKYRILQDNGYINENKAQLGEIIKSLYAWQNSFKNQLSERAKKALYILDLYSVEEEMLYLKSRSIRKFIETAVDEIPLISFTAMQKASEEGKYTTGTTTEELKEALKGGLDDTVKDLASIYKANIKIYRSIKLVLDNLYTLGILNDISRKTREILAGQNKFLLSDAGDILRRIIRTDQTPFIYEKVGNRYRNFMIDEFQDTSQVQWDNFFPLINNSVAEGEDCLVVGDVKQSIYRWRNSDWEIFENIGNQFHPDSFSIKILDHNWRSKPNIIWFNNEVFSRLPSMIEEVMKLENEPITMVYSDVIQKDPGRFDGGYVRMKLYDTEETGKEDALNDLPALIEEIQDKGYKAGDIGILVRTRNEGQDVIDRISSYASEKEHSKDKYSYQVISQDSLLLGSSPVIIFIISALKYMINKDDEVNSSIMYQNYLLSGSKEIMQRPGFIDYEHKSIHGKNGLSLDDFIENVRYLSVYDIIDRLIDFAGLNEFDSANPYLNTLQNNVLEFSGTETNDIPAFLEWWENEGAVKSVSSTGQRDAMQLMTVHKAKGLQFKVVIIPFVSWTFRHDVPPVLWIYSEHKILSRLGAIPVKMKKEFEETFFSDNYHKELGRAAIDKINLLYVAFTRAEECLFANLLPGSRGKTAGSYLAELLNGDDKEADNRFKKYWDDSSDTFSFGKFVKPADADEIVSTGPVLDYPVELREERLKLRLHSKQYYSVDAGQDKRKYGILMHEILSSINTVNDIENSLNDFFRRGIINKNEKDTIRASIDSGLNTDKVKDWFGDNVKILTEQEILLPGGGIKRPDRIILDNDKTTIIDFKFGERHKSHEDQLRKYSEVLRGMGHKDIESYLWYFELSEVKKVQ